MTEHIYLDFNASTPLRPTVIKAMTEAMHCFGNPSSIHKFGRAARSLIDSARDVFAAHFKVEPAQIIFTSGGTEANNMVIKAAKDSIILMSGMEHESVDRSAQKAIKIPVSDAGIIDLEALNKLLVHYAGNKILVSVMLANNETGVIQPVREIATLARQHGAKVHCDAVTAFTKIPFTYSDLGVDYLSVSAHKIGGPKGCGALIVPFTEQLPALLHGGGQEKGHRAGTENILGIVGFAKAVEDSVNDNWVQVGTYRNALEDIILSEYPQVPIYGKQSQRLPNTCYVGMPGIATQTQLMAFDLEGFAVSSGSACSSGKVGPSHVLKSMGYDDDSSTQAIRVSLGWTTTKEQIENFARAWLTLYKRYNGNE